MQSRSNIYYEWQTLLNKYYDLKQSLHGDKSLDAETRLAQELRLESVIIAGLQVISETLDSKTETGSVVT